MKSKNEVNKELKVNLDKLISDSGRLEGQVGWFESNFYPMPEKKKKTEGGSEEGPLPVAVAAYISEFGWEEKGIPARPTMRPAIENENLKTEAEKLSRRVLEGKLTSKEALELLLMVAQGNIKENISTLTEPALKKQTIAARKRKYRNKKHTGSLDKPLVDSGLMLDTVGVKIIG